MEVTSPVVRARSWPDDFAGAECFELRRRQGAGGNGVVYEAVLLGAPDPGLHGHLGAEHSNRSGPTS